MLLPPTLPRLAAPLGSLIAVAFAASGCFEPACAGFDGVCTEEQAATEAASALSCDYSNPCGVVVNCTPCSELPEPERRLDACTPDEELPAYCAGKRGCTEVPWSGGEIPCFPVAGSEGAPRPEPAAGKCCAGTCVSDDVACMDPSTTLP